jgi:hypothetical protein
LIHARFSDLINEKCNRFCEKNFTTISSFLLSISLANLIFLSFNFLVHIFLRMLVSGKKRQNIDK